jgi:hypothetical protein
MLHPAAIAEIAWTWVAVGGYGRRWLATLHRHAGLGSGAERQVILNDPARRQTLLRSVRVCDRAFRKHVPRTLCWRVGREPYAVYLRFVPFACLNVEIRARILDAFRLAYDEAALARVALFFMVARECNDLTDRLSAAEVEDIMNRWKEPPREEALLFVHLVRVSLAGLPPDKFGRLWSKRWTIPVAGGRSSTSLEDHLAKTSHLATINGLYAARPDLPEEVGEALRPFSVWFYMLDEFADMARDREAGKPTVMTTVADPEGHLQASLEAAVSALRSAAPQPERLISLMQFLTDKTLQASRAGLDIEAEIFYRGPTVGRAAAVDSAG